MKAPWSLLFLVTSLWGVHAQLSLSSALAELPSCAQQCLGTELSKSTCLPTNITCICTNAPLQAQIQSCVLASCTVTEGLTTKNTTQNLCGAPIRNKRGTWDATVLAFLILAAAAIIIRTISKVVTGAGFGPDDYSIYAAFAIWLPGTMIELRILGPAGVGKDIWTLMPSQITGFLRGYFIMEVLYMFEVSLIKLSLLFFYLRIFPSATFRKILWGTVIFDVAFGITFVFATLFQCHPVSYTWNQWSGNYPGKCQSINAIAWANGIVSIILDVWMIGLAMSQIIKLQMHWKKKIAVSLMFAVGAFVTLISIVRLQSLVQFGNSTNLTWDNFNAGLWSTIEIDTGIVCACMPSMRVLLSRLFPKAMGSWGSSNGTKKQYHPHEYHSRNRTDISANRSKIPPSIPTDKMGIIYSRSYKVDMEDETNLVPMQDVPAGYGSSRSQESGIGG